jgi:hypothetical protein
VIGVYTFVFRLTFDIFEDSSLLPLALAAIGITIILTAIVYQRVRSETLGPTFSA